MKNSGFVLLILVIAIFIVGLAGAAFFFSGSSAGAGTSAATRPGPDFTVALARTSTGITATVTVTNPGSDDLSEVQVTRADVATLTCGTPLPLAVGKIAPSSKASVVIPYTGPAPAANAPVQLMLQYTFKAGAFNNGSGSRDITTRVP